MPATLKKHSSLISFNIRRSKLGVPLSELALKVHGYKYLLNQKNKQSNKISLALLFRTALRTGWEVQAGDIMPLLTHALTLDIREKDCAKVLGQILDYRIVKKILGILNAVRVDCCSRS